MRRAAAACAVVLSLTPALRVAGQENRIVLGPGYEKGQKSDRQLSFEIPKGWAADAAAGQATGLYGVLVPTGKTLQNTDRVITIAFQKKDPARPDLADLEGFFRRDMAATLAEFPDMQAERWQPTTLNSGEVKFMSVEIFGKAKDKPSPHRLLMIDTGDGFFSITATAGSRKELARPEFERFFNSVRLEK